MMNYITGTTRGLGRALLDALQTEYPHEEFKGLNRPHYNLNSFQNYVKDDFGLYVINAHYEWSQTELLYKLFEANRDRECQICVIGSVSADGDRAAINPYAIQKKALDAACTQLQLLKSKCFVTQIKLGRMKTDLVAHIDAPKMDPKIVSKTIIDVLKMNRKNQYVKSITLDIKV